MEDNPQQSERMRAIDLVHERVDRLLSQHRRGRCEVDQIAGVRDRGPDACFLDPCAKSAHLSWVKWRRLPTVCVLGEDLERLAAVNDCAIDGPLDAAGHRHVRADAQHQRLAPNIPKPTVADKRPAS